MSKLAYRTYLSVKADVYAFGIIIWECLTYQRPWDGKTDAQIIRAMIKGQRPEISDAMDKDLCALMESCWAEDPKDRPHFVDIVKVRVVTGWVAIGDKPLSNAHRLLLIPLPFIAP